MVTAGAQNQGVVLVADRGEERRRGRHGHSHQERVGRHAQPICHLNANRCRHDGRGRVVQHIRQGHCHHHQHSQDHPGGQTFGQRQKTVGNQCGAARTVQRRPQRDHRPQKNHNGPFDVVIQLGQGQDLGQHIGHHDQTQRNGQVDQPQRRRQNRTCKQRDGKPCLVICRHRQAALCQRQAAQPLCHIGAAVARAQQQQDVSGLDFLLADVAGQPAPLSRQPHQHGVLPPRKPKRLRRAPLDPGGFRHHDLDQLQTFASGGQLLLPRRIRKVERGCAAKLVQRLGGCLQNQRVARPQDLTCCAPI